MDFVKFVKEESDLANNPVFSQYALKRERKLNDNSDTRIKPRYMEQPRTQALYSTLLPRLRKDPGSGWSRVSQILGDNNCNSLGVG